MGGRKSYSSKKVTGRTSTKARQSLHKSIGEENPKKIAVALAQFTLENHRQKKEFVEVAKILQCLANEKILSEAPKEVKDRVTEFQEKYSTKNKPL